MEKMLVTTSWDDGHVLDERLASLLEKYGVAGTFYIAPHDHHIPVAKRLSDSAIARLSDRFEIGAHTLSHPDLTRLSESEARREVVESKEYLERVTGKPVTSFCYPSGSYGERDASLVKAAGFTLARTVQRFSVRVGGSLFRLPTTVHAYRHWSDIVPILKAVGVRKFLSCYLNWDELAIHLFDTTARTGGVFHFWGHSWEIDQHNDWARLERVLAHIGGREKAAYVTNGALAKEVEQQQKKSVLFVTPYFLPQGGGLEWYAFEIAQRLQANGWRVEVLTSGEKGSRDITEEYKGLTVHRLGYGLKLSNTPFSFRWFRRVRSVIEQVNPTLINVHMPVPGIGDVAIRAAGSRPVVLTYHAGTMLKGRMVPDFIIGLYERFILPRTIARADSLICSSEFVKNTIPARKAHTTVITPAVDETLCKPDDTIQAIPFEIVFICSFASMHRLKGLEVLREAVKLLTTQFPAISVKVIGEPGAKAIPRVRFIGRKSRAEVVREIQSGAVLILPSLAPAESFGMVLIEAMACKVPVIGSNAGGIPEVIEDGKDGLIVEAGNVSALAEAIARILSDRALAQRMGEAGYEKVLAKYTWDQKVHETENVFAQLT